MDRAVRDWIADAVARRGLALTGALEVVKRRPWATVLRGETSGADVYFKANAPGGRHEPALVSALARLWPERVPAPLAVDPELGWLLTLDHGECMNEKLAGPGLVAAWEELLPRYAEMQLESSRGPERWLSLGVPDRRLERVPALARALIRGNADLAEAERARMLALLPELERVCRELAAVPGAAALEHGDLHGANVLLGRGASWIFDWADASVSHPFASLLVTCNMTTEDLDGEAGRKLCVRLRDAYLEPWNALAPVAGLRALFPLALWVAHVGRALDWDHMLGHADGAERAEWQPRIALWLRRWVERRSWTVKGAWP